MIMSSLSETVTNNENEETKPPPKKRGRKRKSEISIRELEKMVETSSTPVETVSRRGRPRKKVNYYELANPENVEDFQGGLQEDIKYFNLGIEEIKSSKKKKADKNDSSEINRKTSKNEIIDDAAAHQLSNDNEINKKDEMPENIASTPEQENNTHSQLNSTQNQTEKKMNGSVNKNQFINPDLNDLELEATTSTPKNKDKKYNYTGETVKMMNTLFNFFSNKSGGTESGNCDLTNDINTTNNSGNDSILQSSSNNGKRSCRKYKKGKIKEEELEDALDDMANVTCAICNSTMDKNMWSHHKQRYHNNLAWRLGDPPLDLSDQSFVMHTLNMLYKKKKPLYCDKCGEVKKSVVGFLSHQATCKKTEEQLESVKISCEVCGRKMLPVSLSTHMKFLHQNPTQKVDLVEKSSHENNKTLPSKRSAAKKAMKIIENVAKNDSNEEQHFTVNLDFSTQDFAKLILQKELEEKQVIECRFKCEFLATNLDEALTHFDQCVEKPPQGFACKQCLLVSTKLEEIIYHIELDHEVSIEVDDDVTFIEKGIIKMPSFLFSKVKKTERVLFPSAFEWTYKFQEENFSELLFENLPFTESNWPILPQQEVETYLPKLNESCDITRIQASSFINPLNQAYKFKRYQLFEADLHADNKITVFCGGPISSLAWLPTPCSRKNENQVLAVAVLNSPEGKYLTNENYEEPSLIQFWNFGRLKNSKESMVVPKLGFSIGHNHGPVWHMEWCPSGCYNFDDENISRMGVLAVTGSDSVVYLYSVPFFNGESEIGLYYKPKAVMKLLLQRPGSSLLGGLRYYPTKISWSKACGHNYIAVGYTNGFVAVFNLDSSSVLLKYKDVDGIECILPYKCFQAHSHSISALALYHLNGGCRWLMTGSLDRAVNLWDLDNYNYPISSTKKNIVTDGFWLSNWLCHVTGADEGSTSMYVTTMLKQTRDYNCDSNVTLTFSPSTISAISGSDWLNGMLHGNTVGEIVALFPHQLLQITEHRKVFKSKRMLFGYTCLVEKGKSPEQRVEDDRIKKKTLQNLLTKKMSMGIKLSKIKSDYEHNSLFYNEPVLYSEAKQKYGLLFCDNRMGSYEDFPKTNAHQLTAFSKFYGVTHPNQYPMTAINKIVFNPNRQASLYYATGYQAGFVRVSWMEFLKGDEQIK